jgi:fatty-acyl-CoA synthase
MYLPLTPVRLKRHAAQVFGSKDGVVCNERRFTYRQFNERCDRLSNVLLAFGVQKGDRLAYLSFNCHRLLEAYFGIPQIGAILLPLNIRLSPEELAYILNDAEPRMLFFDPEFIPLLEVLRPQLKSIEHYVGLRDAKPDWACPSFYDDLLAKSEPAEIDYRGIEENSVAELFYTSGTTAYPKGVMLTHRNLYLHAFSGAVGLRSNDSDVHLYTIPLFHVNSWGAPHIITLLGGRHVMTKRFDPVSVMELIQRERVTRLLVVPTMVIAMLNHPNFSKYDLSSVKEIIMGGAPTSTALVCEVERRMPGCRAIGGYGLTETSPVICIAHRKAHCAGDAEELNLRRQATAGYPLAGSEIRVVTAEGREVKPDGVEVGEVVVRGDVVMEGYWRQPEATAEAMSGGWLHTGDLATVDGERYILIVDRSKDMILSGGENIASAEIERIIYNHPAVMECAVVAVPDDTWGEVPHAIVALKPGQLATEAEIIASCRPHLAGFKVPKTVAFVEALPKSGTGKILKRVLRDEAWKGRARRVH